jgi:hypothetical protein
VRPIRELAGKMLVELAEADIPSSRLARGSVAALKKVAAHAVRQMARLPEPVNPRGRTRAALLRHGRLAA